MAATSYILWSSTHARTQTRTRAYTLKTKQSPDMSKQENHPPPQHSEGGKKLSKN